MTQLAGPSDIDLVRDASDLVRIIGEHVVLRPKGREHVGLCPFHDDHSPSFAVVTHKGNAFYKCHSCGAGGDVFDFVMNYHKMEFGEALRHLAERAGVTLKPRKVGGDEARDGGVKRTDVRKANSFASIFFRRTFNDPNAGTIARAVIAQRGISQEMVEAFSIGAAPDEWEGLCGRIRKQNLDFGVFVAAGLIKPRKEGEGFYDAFRNRLIFPICDDLGNPIAFGARKIDPQDEPKYLNSSESAVFSKSKTLYGLNRAKRAIIESKQAIVTEGYTDVIACHQAGICNVVGTLGTALTGDHARMLSRLCDTVVLVFDGDEAGQKAADRGLEVFFAEPVDVKVCVLPDNLDPDELLKLEGGRERFEAAVADAIDALEYKIERFRSQLNAAGGLSARQKRLEQFLLELSQMGFAAVQGVRKRLVLSRIAELLKLNVSDVEAAMPKARSNAPRAAAPESAGADETLAAEADAEEEAALSPARRRAEHDVLAALLFEPSCFGALDEAALIGVAQFLDPAAQRIAQIALNWLTTGTRFTMQQIMTELEDGPAKTLASSLYFRGEQACGDDGANASVVLRSAVEALRTHIELHEYQQTVSSFQHQKDSPVQAISALQNILQQRRRHERIASAIPRGVRSS